MSGACFRKGRRGAWRLRLALTLSLVAAAGCNADLSILTSGGRDLCPAGTTQALAADAVVESTGMNLRLDYGNTKYGDLKLVKKLLQELGIRSVIDNDTTSLPALRQLGDLNIRVHVWISDESTFGSTVKALGPTLSAVHVGPVDRNFTISLAKKKRSDPALDGIPLVGPTPGGDLDRARTATAGLGDLSDFVDAVSFSPPVGMPWSSRSAEVLKVARSVAPEKPVITGQAGFSTTTGSEGVSEGTQAKMVVRTLLAQTKAGVRETFINGLFDLSSGKGAYNDNFGLVRSDGTAKPAFGAVKTLLSALADPGPTFAPGSLTFKVGDGPAELTTLLLQKRDGTFLLAVWIETGDKSSAPRTSITLELDRSPRSVRLLRPTDSGEPPQPTVAGNRLTLIVDDGPTLVQLGFGCGAAP